MKISIRKEEIKDYSEVFNLIKEAFKTEHMSDHKEQFLVERLRKSTAFIPELSLVAEIDDTIVGHILLTKLKIKNEQEQFEALALAPVSVLPDYQGKGIGGKLIKAAHEKSEDLGYKRIVLLGHENYYPRFGYQQAHKFDITFPFDAPKENCMIIGLTENALTGISGIVTYPKAFYE